MDFQTITMKNGAKMEKERNAAIANMCLRK